MIFSTKIKFLTALFTLVFALTISNETTAQSWGWSYYSKCMSKAKNDCPRKSGTIRYSMENARPGLNGIFLHNFAGTSEHLRLQFVKEDQRYDLNAGGHLVIKGKLVPAEGLEHLMLGYEYFRITMRLKFVKDDGSYVPYTEYLNVSPEVLATWKYFSIQEGSKIVGKKDGLTQEFEISAMKKEDGSEYYLQVGDQGALIGDGANQGVYGAATWFDYKRFDGLTYKGDINVILDLLCPTVRPVKLEGECSEDNETYCWKLINRNSKSVVFSYTDGNGDIQYVTVPGADRRRAGVKTFCTPAEDGDKITLDYAVYNGEGTPESLTAEAKICDVCKEIRIVRCRPYCGGFLLSLKSDVRYDSYKYVVINPKTGKEISQGYKSFCNGYGFAWFPRNGARQGQSLILKLYSKRKGYKYCDVQFVFNND